ncbi:hypothetical protein [Rhodoplanes azumiensis]|uniref:Uncharacterized protein n=1 Tax=Rhodoplanes azumiensis TaxID=1897628 RepID=A0ABW5AKL7_9BRAD
MQNHLPRSAVRRPLQGRRVALISGAFLAMVVATLMIEQTFDRPLRRLISVPPVERDVSHVGAIRLGPGHDGRCPQYVFDNDTGWIVPSGRVTCDLFDQPPARFGGTGTDRMDTIRDGFRRR